MHDNYKEVNIAALQKEPESVLATWKQALRTRKEHLRAEVYDFDYLNKFIYVESYGTKQVLVALNFIKVERFSSYLRP